MSRPGTRKKTIDKIEPHQTNNIPVITTSDDPLVTGQVTDVRGRPLPNLRMVIVSSDGRRRVSSITAYDGSFSISVPTGGAYTMQVLSGRSVLSTQNIQLDAERVNQDVQVR